MNSSLTSKESMGVFNPGPEGIDFILKAAKQLADTLDRDVREFSVILGFDNERKLTGRNHIGYIGLKPLTLPEGSTISIDGEVYSLDDNGNSDGELRLPLPTEKF